MTTVSYIALLRGINVGGKNIIRMSELRDCLTAAGFSNVQTYIQSGNVLFTSTLDTVNTQSTFEVCLADTFKYTSTVVILSSVAYRSVIQDAPTAFGSQPDLFRSDVLFMKETLSPQEVAKQLTLKDGVDSITAGSRAIYFTRLTSKASSSRLSKIITLPFYKNITIRNWNTATKLLGLLNELDAKNNTKD